MSILHETCEKYEEIIVYGAGTISNILCLTLKKWNMFDKVKCLVVSDVKYNPITKYGLEVHSIYEKMFLGYKHLIIIATQKVTHAAISKVLDEMGCINYFCLDDGIVNEFYSVLYENPIQNNKVLFMNMNGQGYGCNPKYIAEELLLQGREKNEELDLVWAVKDCNIAKHIPNGIRSVEIGSYEYYYELATAKVWIDNARKHYDTHKRKGQYYIQTWHGAAPIKKVEKDVEDKLTNFYVENAKRDSQMADLFVSGSEFYTELYKKSFWYEGAITKVGLPRHDIFWKCDIAKKNIYTYYNLSQDISIILYAPTFRNDFSNKYYDLDLKGIRRALQRKFNKKYIWAISKHPDNSGLCYCFEDDEEYIMVDEYPDFQELLASADILISDYSGCIYDFSYTRRPVFLYQKDLESYILERDFYFPMEELPYINACTNEELINKISNYNEEEYKNKLDSFMKLLGNYDNGNASRFLAQIVLEQVKSH